jgi:hypothetical protein
MPHMRNELQTVELGEYTQSFTLRMGSLA